MGITKLFAAPYVNEVKLFASVDRDIVNLKMSEIEQLIVESKDMYRKTALMYRYIERQNSEFINRLGSFDISKAPKNKNIKIIVVPGMFYKEHPDVGARGDIICEIAQECGFQTNTVPTLSKGSVSHNTKLVKEAILNEKLEKVWLVSFSKGSAEIRLALEQLADSPEIQKVQGWISISGVPYGTPLATLKQKNIVSKAVWGATSKVLGVHTNVSKDLCHEGVLAGPMKISSKINIIHIVGFPIAPHLHPELIKFYNRLTPYGPNDGLTLLEDYMHIEGKVYPMWGLDHFLRSSTISSVIYRMCHFISNLN